MLIFDIETDGLLDTLMTVHCLTIYDTDTDTFTDYADQEGYSPITDALMRLQNADCICGHNIQTFDLPALKKVYPDFFIRGKKRDTLTISRLIWTNLADIDFAQIRKAKTPDYPYFYFPKKLVGSHSLKAWGYRLRDLKDTFGESSDWQHWSPEMSNYCHQDVVVTVRLWNRIQAMDYSERAFDLEHQFQDIAFQQELNGFPFDTKKAVEYYAKLSAEREQLTVSLQALFPPKDKGEWFTPKVNNAKRGYARGQRVWKAKLVPFNPGSRQDIAARLIETRKWKPTVFTETGQPKIDETVLNDLPWPETKELAKYFLIQKRIGQLAEGNNAWLKLVKADGRIHGHVVTNGAVTGRCTHVNPNMAQVPAVGSPWGEEFRSLFYAPAGWSVVGADASNLELRALAHYMAKYDGGEYVKQILSGDIHWANTKALELVPADAIRDTNNPLHTWARNKVAKRFVFAFLYGAGDTKLGETMQLTPDVVDEMHVELKATWKKAKEKLLKQHDRVTNKEIAETIKGAEMRKKFMKNLPALKMLIDHVKQLAQERGYLIGLDGRKLHVRSQHSALNTLIQSAGALAVKKATCILWDDLNAAGIASNVQEVAHVHDEFQLLVKNGYEEQVGEIAVNAFRKAGEYFKLHCPLTGEYKIGRNWAETH